MLERNKKRAAAAVTKYAEQITATAGLSGADAELYKAAYADGALAALLLANPSFDMEQEEGMVGSVERLAGNLTNMGQQITTIYSRQKLQDDKQAVEYRLEQVKQHPRRKENKANKQVLEQMMAKIIGTLQAMDDAEQELQTEIQRMLSQHTRNAMAHKATQNT